MSVSMLQSGTAIVDVVVSTAETRADIASRFGKAMNCSDDVEMVKCLREKSAEEIVSYFQEVSQHLEMYGRTDSANQTCYLEQLYVSH